MYLDRLVLEGRDDMIVERLMTELEKTCFLFVIQKPDRMAADAAIEVFHRFEIEIDKTGRTDLDGKVLEIREQFNSVGIQLT